MRTIRYGKFTALALLYTVASTAQGAGNTDLGDGFVNVRGPGYGAPLTTSTTCDASVDATAIIQQAIDDVHNGGGGVVYLPTGRYCILTHLTVRGGVTLKGVFTAPPPNPSNALLGSNGTTLLAVEGPSNPTGTPFISLMDAGSSLNGISIWHPKQPTPAGGSWTPLNYPYAIMAKGNDNSIQNVMLLNPTRGILLEEAGRHFVKGVWGQPLLNGMVVDGIADVGRIEDVHFWPFWSQDPKVMSYTQSNAIAFIFKRSDWQIVNEVFTLGYYIGMAFDHGTYDRPGLPPGTLHGATNGVMTNLGFDVAQYGIVSYGTQRAGVTITNVNVALTSPNPSYALANYAPVTRSSHLTVHGMSVWGTNATGSIAWSGPGLLMMSGLRVADMVTGTPPIRVTAGDAMITNSTLPTPTTSGVGIRVESTAGKVVIQGNMLFGKTISNSGTQTTIGTNSP